MNAISLLRSLIAVALFLCFGKTFGQQQRIDSLLKAISNSKSDSSSLQYYQKICELCDVSDNLKYGEQGLDLVKTLESKKGVNVSKKLLLENKVWFLKIIRLYYDNLNDYDQMELVNDRMIPVLEQLRDTAAVEERYFEKADYLIKKRKINEAFEMINSRLGRYENAGILRFVALFQSKLAQMYDRINYTDKMIVYYEKYLATNVTMEDVNGIAAAHAYLSQAFNYARRYREALEHGLKSLEYFKEEKDQRKIFRALSEICSAYEGLGDHNKALEFSERGLQIANELKDNSLLDYIHFNRISIYMSKKEYLMAEVFAKKWMEYAVRSKNGFNVMNASIALGKINYFLNRETDALKFIATADSIARIQNDIYAARQIYNWRYRIFEHQKEYKKALENRLQYDVLNDSISKIENHQGFEKKEMLAQFEKNELKLREEQRIRDEKAEGEKKQQRLIILSISIGLCLVIILLLFIYRNYRLKKRSNLELAGKNEEILAQKKLVEEKQQEILDSIRYAKRIQNAHLPNENYIEKKLKGFIKR